MITKSELKGLQDIALCIKDKGTREMIDLYLHGVRDVAMGGDMAFFVNKLNLFVIGTGGKT